MMRMSHALWMSVWVILALALMSGLAGCGWETFDDFQKEFETTLAPPAEASETEPRTVVRPPSEEEVKRLACSLLREGYDFPLKMDAKDTPQTQYRLASVNNGYMCGCLLPQDRPEGLRCSE